MRRSILPINFALQIGKQKNTLIQTALHSPSEGIFNMEIYKSFCFLSASHGVAAALFFLASI